MSRAFRFAPPVVTQQLVARPRLLAQLRQRFERRVTAIVAAPGFGKTTLLAQALTENTTSPLGEDRWLTCQWDDASQSFLAEAVYAAVGATGPVPEDQRAAASAVADAIWSAAPGHLALVLDDAHLITRGSPGATFLAALVRELPQNGHLVLASRPPAPLAMSRLRVTGEAVVLGEDDMEFRADEIASFAATRGVAAASLAEVGRWPALAELTATVGPHAADEFVREELASHLSDSDRDVLGVLIAVGGMDDEIAAAVFGDTTDLDRLLAGLPLVVYSERRWRSLHGLWGSALQHRVRPERVAEARTLAGQVLRGRREYHDAMKQFVDAAAWDDARALIVEVCEVCTPLVSQGVLEAWWQRLPTTVRTTPEGLLLEAMIAEPTRPDAATRILRHAIEEARGAVEVSYACRNALVQLAFWRSDRAEMRELADRLAELRPDEHPEAAGWVTLLNALLAPTDEQTRAALADPSLFATSSLNPVQDWLHAHIALRKLGQPETAETLATRSLAHDAVTMAAVSRSAIAESRRMRGLLDDLKAMLPDIVADLEPDKVLTSPELVATAAIQLDVLGRHVQAAEVLSRFRPVVEASPVSWAVPAAALGEAFHLAAVGEDKAAAARLEEIADLPVTRSRAIGLVSVSALTVLYVLLPEVRPRWDATPPAGCLAHQFRVLQALVELRERGSLDGVRALPVEARRLVAATLPPPWAAEVAAAMVAVGHDEGRVVLEGLGVSARAPLRRHVDEPRSPLVVTARALLRELPAVPSFRLGLRTLGPLELSRDGAAVTVPELRRERVRQLLAYLLTHERPTRTAITAQLWPDLADAAAARNLRVTLAYLQAALEPDRNDLDPPFFVRSTAGALYVHVGEGLDVDSVAFERALDEAAQFERHGALAAAVERYRAALGLWRGDYFAGLAGDDWLQWERDRIRARYVTSAVRAGDLLLARGDVDAADALGTGALGADQWSESAYQLLVGCALSRADMVGARRQLRACGAMLAELGVRPQPRTVALGRRLEVAR